MTLVGLAATSFIGYSLGWIRGYEKKEKDGKQIEMEMNDFWKGVKQRGL